MKKMKDHIKELQGRSVVDLEKLAAQLRDEVRDLSFEASQNQLKAVRSLRAKKREIARVLTVAAAKAAQQNKQA